MRSDIQDSVRRRSPRKARRATRIGALGLGVALALAAGQANAFFCYVFWAYGAPCPVVESGAALAANTANQANSLASQLEAAAEYITQATRWIDTLKHYADMITNLQSMITRFGLPQSADMQHVEPDFNVVERCGSAGGSMSQVIGTMVGFDMNSSVQQKQRDLCVSIQRMQNKQYNELIDYLKDAATQLATMDGQMKEMRMLSSTPGQMSGAIFALDQTNSQIAQKMGEFEARMKAYDTYIKTQRQVQRTLAQVAMRGQPSILGQVVKTAALETALSASH